MRAPRRLALPRRGGTQEPSPRASDPALPPRVRAAAAKPQYPGRARRAGKGGRKLQLPGGFAWGGGWEREGARFSLRTNRDEGAGSRCGAPRGRGLGRGRGSGAGGGVGRRDPAPRWTPVPGVAPSALRRRGPAPESPEAEPAAGLAAGGGPRDWPLARREWLQAAGWWPRCPHVLRLPFGLRPPAGPWASRPARAGRKLAALCPFLGAGGSARALSDHGRPVRTWMQDLVSELLRAHFTDSKTKVGGDALWLMAELLKIFVVEAAVRSARQAQAEDLTLVDVDQLEKVLPQLLLDF
ncbi:centromere protein X [Mustela erminea]|uniref:centromere protein X n=1 Tax=Mustela erminea TaxID=36723 RepID=UPI0013870A0A|nr:centromere protein X [Mustela erminea]